MSDLEMDVFSNKKNIYEYIIQFVIVLLIILIVLGGLLYMVYIGSLKNRECNAMNTLYPSIDGHLRSIDSNCSGNLYDYYIKTAYNACSGGAYKNDFVDICNLKAVIRQGVRCLDFELYNVGDEPVVATSTSDNFYIKETYNFVLFSNVMDTINSYAFGGGGCPNPNDPLLIHLRIKSMNQNMYKKLAKIFKSYSNIMLGNDYSYENSGKNIGATPLLAFKGKIILIIDKSNNAFFENKDLMEYVNLTSNSVFMRVLRYSNIKNSPDIHELQEFNKKNMSIVLPDNEINPPNPSGVICREAGCQMVAMRYQYVDDFLEENKKFFDDVGYAFELKPRKMRYKKTNTKRTDYYKFDF